MAMRVYVNRVWKNHFGTGIVDTPSNFGFAGERPTNPELLDYLAQYFVDNGMSTKKLHARDHAELRLSAQRRQSTKPTTRRIPPIGSTGAPTATGWMPSRSAIPCWRLRQPRHEDRTVRPRTLSRRTSGAPSTAKSAATIWTNICSSVRLPQPDDLRREALRDERSGYSDSSS